MKSDLPVVCSLSPAALEARQEGRLASLARTAQEHEELPDGYRLRFAPSEDLLTELATVVNLERQCCRFLQFTITVEPDGGPIQLDLTGPSGTHGFVAALFES